MGIIDEAAGSVAEAVAGSDLVVLSVPVKATRTVLEEIRPHLGSNTVLTDVGSTKTSFVNDVREVFGELPAKVIPGHPIAGSERAVSGRPTPDCLPITR